MSKAEPTRAHARTKTNELRAAEVEALAGKLSAADVAKLVMDAVASKQFYIFSHPPALVPRRRSVSSTTCSHRPASTASG